jgi:pimeloyl-ACP methyl ester carboxylesterase
VTSAAGVGTHAAGGVATEDEIRHVPVRGGTLAYIERGAPGAPLVVLMHGFPDFPKTFFPLMARLGEAGYRTVAPFLRGYAPSTTEGPFHAGQLGRDLSDVVRALSPGKPAFLVGHDWGAVATYAAVASSPSLFRRAVTLAVPHVAAFERSLWKNPAQRKRSAYMALLATPLLGDRFAVRNDFEYIEALWRRWSPGYTPDPLYMLELKACLRASMPGPVGHYRALRAGIFRMPRPPAGPVRRITVPLLHLHGAEDGCIAFEAGDGEERYFENEFRRENLPGLGHFLHLEDPDRIAAAILAFVGTGNS